MQWELVVALVIAIPVILFPAAFVWYLNAGGIYAAIKEARAKRAARERKAVNQEQVEQLKKITEIVDKANRFGGYF
jgi:hypothetical protein